MPFVPNSPRFSDWKFGLINFTFGVGLFRWRPLSDLLLSKRLKLPGVKPAHDLGVVLTLFANQMRQNLAKLYHRLLVVAPKGHRLFG